MITLRDRIVMNTTKEATRKVSFILSITDTSGVSQTWTTRMTYCNSLTDNQLENVLLIEYDRKERGEDRDLYVEAREECLRRGIEPDQVLETC